VGRAVLRAIATIATPETLLRWHPFVQQIVRSLTTTEASAGRVPHVLIRDRDRSGD
jgi:hypothetical protein